MSNGTSSGPSGVITRSYKSGSIIYFEGDKSEYIYVLKSGKVVLTSLKLDTGEEVKEEVRQGEFFGVKSSLGKYPREETAQTVGNTQVLVLTPADFERLVLNNSNVVRKMLRVFSNQLRRIVKMERSVLGEGEIVNPGVELFKIGEYYYKAGVPPHAQYAYKRYMEYYPDGEHASLAMKRIRAIDSGEAMPEDEGPVSPAASAGPSADMPMQEKSGSGDLVDFDDFSRSEAPSRDTGGGGTSLADEMDDFLSDDRASGDEDFSMPGEQKSESIFDMSDSADASLSKGNYSYALGLYQKITALNKISNSEEREVTESAYFNAGRCFLELKKPKESLEMFSKILQNFPDSPLMKNAVFHIGMIFESVRQNDKAISYYNKVLNMTPKDRLNGEALSKIKNLQGK